MESRHKLGAVVGFLLWSFLLLEAGCGALRTLYLRLRQAKPDPLTQQDVAGLTNPQRQSGLHGQFATAQPSAEVQPSPTAVPCPEGAPTEALQKKKKQEVDREPIAFFTAVGMGRKGTPFAQLGAYAGCSVRWKGSRMPVVILTTGLSREELEMYRTLGFQVRVVAPEVLKSYYKPVYSVKEATAKFRRVDPRWKGLQQRKDGWTTYLKFFLWNETGYERALFHDADGCLSEAPEPWVNRPDVRREHFIAFTEKLPKHWGFNFDGMINTHGMLLRPSTEMFQLLLAAAADGRYLPRSNTEQDILESFFGTRLEFGISACHHMYSDRHWECFSSCLPPFKGKQKLFGKRCLFSFQPKFVIERKATCEDMFQHCLKTLS